jgi:hypothetical protein
MESGYAERLESLRVQFAAFKEPPCVAEDAPAEFKDVQVARRRFVLACLALDVPDGEITAALPGFNPDIPVLRPAWSFSEKPFFPERYFLDVNPDVYVALQLKRFETYLRNELSKARGRYVEMKLKRPAPHRTNKLDLAGRYFVTVRRKILKHTYAEIALDHIRPQPETEKQLRAAENRLKSAVHAVVSEVKLHQSLG